VSVESRSLPARAGARACGAPAPASARAQALVHYSGLLLPAQSHASPHPPGPRISRRPLHKILALASVPPTSPRHSPSASPLRGASGHQPLQPRWPVPQRCRGRLLLPRTPSGQFRLADCRVMSRACPLKPVTSATLDRAGLAPAGPAACCATARRAISAPEDLAPTRSVHRRGGVSRLPGAGPRASVPAGGRGRGSRGHSRLRMRPSGAPGCEPSG